MQFSALLTKRTPPAHHPDADPAFPLCPYGSASPFQDDEWQKDDICLCCGVSRGLLMVWASPVSSRVLSLA